jgi:hypothetical protein
VDACIFKLPEVLSVIEEFEYASIQTTQSNSNEHPESSVSEQQIKGS